ncbi:CoA ester lyase [Rhodococcus sp. GXMU-t2271]|uniref:HpcH/HpaI aldolase/citrate lyase family protein n=1 Tax=Rhodococcus sp. GXMU-t2271 TaxID=3059079 RepID=UPI00352AE22B
MHTPIIRSEPIDAAHARSWVLVPANRPESFAAAASSAADAVIVDLEDAVVPAQKPMAREALAAWLSNGAHAWVRINATTTPFWADDVAFLSGLEGVDGVVLAKTENPAQVQATAEHLPPGTRIVALVETALGMTAVHDIARAPATFRLAFGSGDFRRDTGAHATFLAMACARSQLVIASRAAALPGPIDGPTIGLEGTPLVEDTEHAAEMGLTGRLCMHSEHAAVVNRILSPTDADILWAREVIDTLGEHGEHISAGSDLPRLARARRITGLAALYSML